jgi:Family of unknown function (DUF6491)
MQARLPRWMAFALLATAAGALLGCASIPGAAHEGASAQKSAALPGKPGCFWLRDFDGSWTVLNDQELIVYAPLQTRPYLIKLFAPVPGLKFDQRLGFQDVEHSGMICNGELDNLVVPHWAPHLIPIVAVRRLSAAQERQLLAENHINRPPRSAPPKGNRSAARSTPQ